MTDIVERLRDRYCSACGESRGKGHQDDCLEAADEIERMHHALEAAARGLNRQEKKIERLREIEKAARWFAMHTPAKHIPGLLQRAKYEQLQDALAKLKEDK